MRASIPSTSATNDGPAGAERAAPVPAPAAPRANGFHTTRAPRSGRLVLENISKSFPNSTVHALRDVSLTCEPGEFVVVVGPSGCGKSTLLNIAAGMIRADSGNVTLDDRSITKPGPERAMVFQDHGLFPWLTAAQNIAFGLKMAGIG